jgi:hypothetical protein
MKKSRSSDEIEKLSSELSWSTQRINGSFVVVERGGIGSGGGERNPDPDPYPYPDPYPNTNTNTNPNPNTNTNTNTNTSKIRRRNSTIARRKSVLLNSFNNNGSSIFRKSSSSASSIKFPINAFTVENSAEFCNPTLFAEVYSMAFISACKLYIFHIPSIFE